jgi:hypothetical protein
MRRLCHANYGVILLYFEPLGLCFNRIIFKIACPIIKYGLNALGKLMDLFPEMQREILRLTKYLRGNSGSTG